MEAIGKDLRSQLHFTGELTEAQQTEMTSKISGTQWPGGRIPRTLSRAPGPACWLCPHVSEACLRADLPLVLPPGTPPRTSALAASAGQRTAHWAAVTEAWSLLLRGPGATAQSCRPHS